MREIRLLQIIRSPLQARYVVGLFSFVRIYTTSYLHMVLPKYRDLTFFLLLEVHTEVSAGTV